jgi:pimeloyl-ACP methyl ester carboxylesterase
LLALGGAPVSGSDGADRSSRRATLLPCHLEGLSEQVRCGRLTVERDPEQPAAGSLEVTFAVVPALAARRAADPLFVFPGGPGQAASGYGRLVAATFDEVRETRDLVLIDPRGTTGDGALRCNAESLDDLMTMPAAEGVRALRRCAEELGIEPRWYSSRHVAADAEALRAALGYESVNLWGGSYGTRFALEYASRYPERTRAVVLDGAVGPGTSILVSAARHADRAFALLVDACEADAACARAFPDPSGDRDAFIGDAETTTHALRSAVTGLEQVVALDRDARIGLVRGALYSPRHAALLPLALRRAVTDDVGPILALGAATASWSLDTMAIGATLAVLCADEAGRIPRERVAAETAATFVGDSYARFWLGACAALPPAGNVGLAGDEALTRPLATPALVLSGERDPVTPPEAGAEAAGAFARAAHVVVPGAGHNVSHLGCVPGLMRAFLDSADPDAVDGSCVENAVTATPPFALGPTGFTP